MRLDKTKSIRETSLRFLVSTPQLSVYQLVAVHSQLLTRSQRISGQGSPSSSHHRHHMFIKSILQLLVQSPSSWIAGPMDITTDFQTIVTDQLLLLLRRSLRHKHN
ncbi:hypothetical protein DsansV1_C17g0144361 [Dioscorea sansibarensis]